MEGVGIEIPIDPMEVEDTVSFLRDSNLAYWPEAHFLAGLHFQSFFISLSTISVFTQPIPMQTPSTYYWGFWLLTSFSLGMEEIFFLYNMKQVEAGKNFFIAKKSARQLVLSLPNTHKGDPPKKS